MCLVKDSNQRIGLIYREFCCALVVAYTAPTLCIHADLIRETSTAISFGLDGRTIFNTLPF